VIFLIDVDIPWNKPSREILRPDAKLIHLEVDPTFTSIPTWGFQIDLAITGCSERSLPVLNAMLREKVKQRSDAKAVIEERRKQVEKQHIAIRKELEAKMDAVKKEKPIHPLWLSKCVSNLMDEQTILINETVTSPLQEVLDVEIPGSVFNTPPAGHLGWGLGAAIGTKLGAPEKIVIAALGDGAYIFSSPLACHFVANKYDIPFLAIIYNNQAWNASINTALELYPDGVAEQSKNFPGTDLTPSPRFELIAEACGAYSERVEDPRGLEEALERALDVVRKERRQAVVNVICRSPL
jgi:acetolactate synthase-1/2/3 large subunit